MAKNNTISKRDFEEWFFFYLSALTTGATTSDGTDIRSPLETDIIPKDINDLIQATGGSTNTYDNAKTWVNMSYLFPMMQARESLFAIGATRETILIKPATKSIPSSKTDLSGYKQDGQTYYAYKDEAINRKTLTDPKDFFEIIKPGPGFDKIEKQGEKSTQFKALYYKLVEKGLIDLLFYKNQIQNFARKRYINKAELTKSALNAASSTGDDLQWLSILSRVYNTLILDPIIAWQMNEYFPGVAQFIFNALAATADYSNNGAGGSIDDPLNDPIKVAKMLFESFGTDEEGNAIFKPAWTLINTGLRIQQALDQFPVRANIPPRTPDVFHLRIGASNFYVPPVSISINSAFKAGSLTGGAIRQKNSPKFNAGYKETSINLRLYFPNYEEIWGISVTDGSNIDLTKDFNIDFSTDSDDKIDKFLSSLRGLVATFKASPIIPIKNHYINNVHGITGVALTNMSVSTIPSYPFCLIVDLEMLSYNHKPFLPMIKDFNQSLHWGKYRHYMGRAAKQLDDYVSKDFLVRPLGLTTPVESSAISAESERLTLLAASFDGKNAAVEPVIDPVVNVIDSVLRTNIIQDWTTGNNISIFMPERVQSKIFTPDISSFRSNQEKILNDTGRNVWNGILYRLGIDINETGYGRDLDSVINTSQDLSYPPSLKRKVNTAIDILLSGQTQDTINEKVYNYLAVVWMLKNPKVYTTPGGVDYILKKSSIVPSDDITGWVIGSKTTENSSVNLRYVRGYLEQQANGSNGLLNQLIEDMVAQTAGTSNPTEKQKDAIREKVKEDLKKGFNQTLYERFFMSGPIRDFIESANKKEKNFKEWEVPMIQVDLDQEKVIVDGVSVSIGNNVVKMQVQMQEEPTYQHIGGKDTYINISMTVFGESELIKIRNIFEHINGLARLEHAAGVIGFLGIKNIITALCGVKYVLPLKYNVDTIPNFPHVYKVNLTLVDFDIFQQKREKLSSDQQQKFVEEFGTKKNPFLRIKQLWGTFNAYPDLPLEVYNKEGDVVGCMDPDYYFRSFEMFDRDVIVNQSIQETNEVRINYNQKELTASDQQTQDKNDERYIADIIGFLRKNDFKALKVWVDANNLKPADGYRIVNKAVQKYSSLKRTLVLDYVETLELEDKLYLFTDTQFSVPMGEYKVGEVTSSTEEKLKATLTSVFDQGKAEDKQVSVDPDDLMAGVEHTDSMLDYVHGLVYAIPASTSGGSEQVPAMIQTAQGYNFGYLSRQDGRFYMQNNKFNVSRIKSSVVADLTKQKEEIEKQIADGSKDPLLKTKLTKIDKSIKEFDVEDKTVKKVSFIKVSDSQTPDKTLTASHLPEISTKAFAEYQTAYSAGGTEAESVTASKGSQHSVSKHWEKMLIDTSYRDVSGRMVRAYPTYMLWLIDEGGIGFAGTKIFDNFYGLQSIIDFSVVSSEDILGDTLIFRVSNMYSKLSQKESSRIFDPGEPKDTTSMTEDLSTIVDTLLNRSRNIRAHYENKYVVDIENIRLKPGVRVHLRVGYGSNPNSLQTVFNGIITNVEMGEIVTVTAQSDAIELSPVINSANKKGDSGKIDGGINTGMFLSEPRDLMVKLLSMGTSRFRESFAHATRGTIFSENKFGIRHFGNILYEPLNEVEKQKNDALKTAFKNAIDTVSNDGASVSSLLKGAWNATGGTYNGVDVGVTAAATAVGGLVGGPLGAITAGAAGGFMRSPVLGHMRTLMSNLSTQRDYEIFKRNIYPGNGLGVAQFLGGDLDAGWSTASSIGSDEYTNMQADRKAYLTRLGDAQWSTAMVKNSKLAEAQQLANGGKLNDSSGAVGTAKILSGLMAVAGATAVVAGMPVIGGAVLGTGLLGATNGRGAASVFETMGLVSSLDDDVPGFDEISFRAQTYMRSVWDMFQLCAKLLPNYIVAVRPFEDRSTVFYGKPHWLYTSGVVPISTGFMHPDSAIKKGIKDTGPTYATAGQELLEILAKVNKEASPMQDGQAFGQGFEPLSTSIATIKSINEGTDSYAPVAWVKDPDNGYTKKLINFLDPRRMFFVEKGEIVARLPVAKGIVNVGFHLPFGEKGEIEMDINKITTTHKQIPQLPYRYQFPYFTDRKTTSFDGKHNGYIFNFNIKTLIGYTEKKFKYIRGLGMDDDGKPIDLKDDDGVKDHPLNYGAGGTYFNILAAEFKASNEYGSDGLVDPSNEKSNGIDEISYRIKTAAFQFTQEMLKTSPEAFVALAGTAFMDGNSTSPGFNIIRVPLPSRIPDPKKRIGQSDYEKDPGSASNIFTAGIDAEYDGERDDDYTFARFEYNSGDTITAKIQGLNDNRGIYAEWGMPETAEDEQWYIAMKWPYKPDWSTDSEINKAFTSQYDDSKYGLTPLGDDNLAQYGNVINYKSRKVLVYSPTTNTAVCLKPAYYLWGEVRDNTYYDDAMGNTGANSSDQNSLTGAENVLVDAVVSPDAAYHLGILNSGNKWEGNPSRYSYGFEYFTDNDSRQKFGDADNPQDIENTLEALGQLAFGNQTDQFWLPDKASKFIGLSVIPFSRSCYFTFVEDDFPLGVIPNAAIVSKRFEMGSNQDGNKWQPDDNFIIGFAGEKDGSNVAVYNDASNDGGSYSSMAEISANGGDFGTDGDKHKSYRSFGYLADILKDTDNLKDVLGDNKAITTNLFTPKSGEVYFKSAEDSFIEAIFGGNPLLYLQAALKGEYDKISKDKLYEVLINEVETFKDTNKNDVGRENFVDVFDETGDPQLAMSARANYDEDYNVTTRVIAGDGRTLSQAREIWDFFRITFHEDEMVKSIFSQTFGIDANSEEALPEFVINLLTGKGSVADPIMGRYTSTKELQSRDSELNFSGPGGSKTSSEENGVVWIGPDGTPEKLKDISKDARYEFSRTLGEEFVYGGKDADGNAYSKAGVEEAIKFSAETFLDNGVKTEKVQSTSLFQDIDTGIRIKYGYLSGLLGFLLGSMSNKEIPDPFGYDASVLTQDSTDSTRRNVLALRKSLGIVQGDADKDSINDRSMEVMKQIDTPRKLYLFIVGWYRQVMWSDAYNRAWVVLKPNRRLEHYSSNPLLLGNFGNGGLKKSDGKWDFSPLYQSWQAFIDPNSSYAKSPDKFKEFLIAHAKEGDSATSWLTSAFDDGKDFWDKNVGVYFTAISDGLSGLLNMFKLSMAQMGYGLAEADNLNKQANVLNKLLNDSIYYSLGNPGSLLRAVDNPFTREYGEPVVEVREPFQRIHYLSSFSHIISNRIQENINDVATVITAVSDGKYPVTVALDKGAPSERQVEKTVETGLYFDNIRGSGFFGVLHPFFHPFETFRGLSKTATGSADELTARRVALSHLKENIKDIYTGELITVGNADIRPHDLVYLADVYERMYGIFEVEQVVHHFTPEMGFITSITPNALVTINDPARWFMTSWLNSWMSLQTIRNDTRFYLGAANNGRTGLVSGGQVSVDQLNEALSAQMMGGVQYTHGSSALVKDVMANFTANAMPDARQQMLASAQASKGQDPTAQGAMVSAMVTTGLATVLGAGAAVAATILTGGAALPLMAVVGSGVVGAGVFGDLAWSGWSHIKNNLLDQHGCYVQYLSKNGQPMDAGLSYNQGMVVGKYHSKALLPGILGVNSRKLIRTPEGYSHIRTDDLLKNLGWKEKEISDLVRHISYENALVNAQVIKYSGIGPEKAGMNQFFKVVCRVTQFIDGDTFIVEDVLRPGSTPFKVRFEGINAAEINKISGTGPLVGQGPNYGDISINTDPATLSWIDPTSPGGRALAYVYEALVGRVFVLRVAPSVDGRLDVLPLTQDDFTAGAQRNNPDYYLKDTNVYDNGFGTQIQDSYDRVMGSIFYRIPTNDLDSIFQFVKNTFINLNKDPSLIKEKVKGSIYSDVLANSGTQVVYQKFDSLLSILTNVARLPGMNNYYYYSNGENDLIDGLSESNITLFNALIDIKILELLYVKSSEWPLILWDEYYDDGTPATLNWELVVSNLAGVYTKNLLYNTSNFTLNTSNITPGRMIP